MQRFGGALPVAVGITERLLELQTLDRGRGAPHCLRHRPREIDLRQRIVRCGRRRGPVAFHVGTLAGTDGTTRGQAQVAPVNRVVVTEDDRTLDAVLELAHVAGPAVRLQCVKRRGRDEQRLLVHIAAEPFDEVPRQDQHVALALAQRRDGDRKH